VSPVLAAAMPPMSSVLVPYVEALTPADWEILESFTEGPACFVEGRDEVDDQTEHLNALRACRFIRRSYGYGYRSESWEITALGFDALEAYRALLAAEES
jgi:hypothetical protein